MSEIAQLPGCLPAGATPDSILTVEEFAVWRRLAVRTVRNKCRKQGRAAMPGVLRDGLKPTIYLRAYLRAQGEEFQKLFTI